MVEFIQKRNILLFSAGAIAGLSFEAALEEKFPRFFYSTVRPLPLPLKVADEVLEFVFMRFKRILAHHWHFNNVKYKDEYVEFGVNLNGASKGNSSHIPFFGVVAHLGGRQYGHLVGINQEDPKFVDNTRTYTIGFRNPGQENIRLCELELPISSRVMLLAGPDKGCIAYAFDKKGQPLPLVKLSDLMHRNDMPHGLRVL